MAKANNSTGSLNSSNNSDACVHEQESGLAGEGGALKTLLNTANTRTQCTPIVIGLIAATIACKHRSFVFRSISNYLRV